MVPRQEVESDLELLGLVVLENRVKPMTKGVIRQLNSARIRTVMVTGDNLLTAMSVAKECGIIRAIGKTYMIEHDVKLKNKQGRSLLLITKYSTFEQANLVSHIDREDLDQITNMLTSKYQLGIAGPTFGVLIKEYPELVNNLMAVCDVFARMSPEQKQGLVNHLQSLDYTVLMCGDGANDCAALKAAQAGISLSDAEASIAAPFTSKVPDIRCVPTLIREGRASLVTSFGVFKFMANYGLLEFTSVIILYYYDTDMTDWQFLYIDFFLVLGIALFYGNIGACKTLSPNPPPKKVMSLPVFVSVFGQMLIFAGAQMFIFFWAEKQPWFFMNILSESYFGDPRSMQGTINWCLSNFQYIVAAFVHSKAAPYRETMLKNRYLCLAMLVTTGVSLYLALFPSTFFIDLFQYDPISSFEARLFIVFVAGACCGVSIVFNIYIVEYLLLEKLERWRKISRLKNPNSSLLKWERSMITVGNDISWMKTFISPPHDNLPLKPNNKNFRKTETKVLDETAHL